jgi:hypothetical protein
VWFQKFASFGLYDCQGKLPQVPWAAGYGPKLQDTIDSLQRHPVGESHNPYQEVTLPLQAKEMVPPN